ncbi:Ribosome maturation factor RimP [Rhodococcus sp. RD6.2]|jgi:ribosome maturation factor RimP|uniref:ribosome maturation factor RimP n=1 Tax=Rhodococcus sp. RD6.2 TaxID=260936 RepID=UPI00063B617F|nr:ribosome maturation factor RimP [Rhodococcus sp. RD6.2]CRK53221.1 Ribosome maturation factor RimP [Rhodococcus sp. RD6.2]
MPVPSRERVIELLADLMPDQGYDLEDVTVSKAGSRSVVRVMVDSDSGLDLDDVAELSRQISERLDAATEFGETPYTLEVTSPGIDRPLTEPRHWRRAQGRRVRVEIGDEQVLARVGALGDGVVALVLPAKGGPVVREIALADVANAVVQVEFSPPNAQEMELAGGLAAGRAAAGEVTDGIETDDIEGGGLDK